MSSKVDCGNQQEISYSLGNFPLDCCDFITSVQGSKFTLDVAMNVSDWFKFFHFKEKASDLVSKTLDPLRNTFDVLDLVKYANCLKNDLFYSSKDSENWQKNAFSHTAAAIGSAAGTLRFLHQMGFFVLEKALKGVRAVYWVAFGLVDTLDIWGKLGEIRSLENRMSSVSSPQKDLMQSRVNLVYLQVLQSITFIAIAAISLISLVFVSIAECVLLNSSVVILVLSSCWLSLECFNYFYEKIINHQETQLAHLNAV